MVAKVVASVILLGTLSVCGLLVLHLLVAVLWFGGCSDSCMLQRLGVRCRAHGLWTGCARFASLACKGWFVRVSPSGI